MEEVWKDIPGYEGLYQASTLGRVRSLDKETHGHHGCTILRRGKIKAIYNSPSSLPHVDFTKDGKNTRYALDVVIAMTFIGDCQEGMYVAHIDGDEYNSSVDNIVFATADEYLEINKRALAKKDAESNTDEVWGDIPGYDGAYQASTIGRVRSVTRIVDTPKGPVKRQGKLVKLVKTRSGYTDAHLCVQGAILCRKVHRLVAETFIPNQNNLPEVDHIDMDRANNRVENLQWITHIDNCHRSIDAGNYANNFAKAPKVDQATRAEWAFGRPVVRDDGVVYASISEAARANGCKDRCSIKNVLAGRTQTCMGHSFSYA